MMIKPGRELDAIIADKVFNLSSIDDGEAHGDKPSGTYSLLEPDEYSPTGVSRSRELPHYSTDLNTVWQVVERLKQGFKGLINPATDGFLISIHLEQGLHEKLPDYYYVRFEFESSSYCASGETLPHAICLAALMVVK